MNPSRPVLAPTKLLLNIGLKSRRLLPRQQCHTFGPSNESGRHRIERIYVINLDRQPDRWSEMSRELSQVLDSSRAPLTKRAVRHTAVDARCFEQAPREDEEEVDVFYTLADQLFVEPQPLALPDRLELDRPIRMSQPEIAVARSHISVWRRIAAGEHAYALVLEDDVWFQGRFARHLDLAWAEMDLHGGKTQRFDILYLSYKEVRHGAQKTFLTRSVFRPVRGLWYLSGYVLSREGAAKLLTLLPCRGPVDLWINHQFGALDVQATKRSIISQRRNGGSTNSYSILPALTKIGVLDCEGESLFRIRPEERPVFAFGAQNSGLSSLAMALSMLGYRCCSDLQNLPTTELENLLEGRPDRIFDAYVNIGSLQARAATLEERYPRAKFIITTSQDGSSEAGTLDIMQGVSGRNVAVLPAEATNRWKEVCEHLRCPPPVSKFPDITDVGQRRLLEASVKSVPAAAGKEAKRDSSPWLVESRRGWRGIRSVPAANSSGRIGSSVSFNDQLANLDSKRWFLRDDTFAGNRALFRPSNVELCDGIGAVFTVKREPLGVRDYSAASISSRDRFLFGRFEADLRATNVPGIVTGFFLHRDSPRQEIDVEIVGCRSDRMLVNVFYNPGGEGASFDYGYRGSPSCIELGFDASESAHRYAIEWSPGQIRWLVDEQLVHERANWDPTPVPQLPMTLHINTWPSRSKDLAGRLASRRLPATAVVRMIAVEANLAST
jgi:GR25 family glycosyltransferase involved in LPS biosynthesis